MPTRVRRDGGSSSRRQFLRTAMVASGIAIAGCSGQGEPTPEPTEPGGTPTATATASPTATATASPTQTRTATPEPPTEAPTETPTETPEPGFAYPDGASADRIDPGRLADGHSEAITRQGSANIDIDVEETVGSTTASETRQIRLGGMGVGFKLERDDWTIRLWDPVGSRTAFWQVDTGGHQHYVTNDEGSTPEDALREERDELFDVLEAGVWSAAEERTADDGTPVVEYTASAFDDEEAALFLVRGDTIQAFSASILLEETGLVRRLHYVITSRDGFTSVTTENTSTYSKLGAPVGPPTWWPTAQSDGVAFDNALSMDGTFVIMELVDGVDLQSSFELVLYADRDGVEQLPGRVEVGDTLYLWFDRYDDFRVSVNSPPDDGTPFDADDITVEVFHNDHPVYWDTFP